MSSPVGPFTSRRFWNLWDIMHNLRSQKFFRAFHQASALSQMLLEFVQTKQPVFLLKGDWDEKISELGDFSEECSALGLTGVVANLNRVFAIARLAKTVVHEGRDGVIFDSPAVLKLWGSLSDSVARIPDDLAGHVFLAVDPKRVHLYQDPRPFGDEVFDAFPSARTDIEEAAKCLAVERGTACVFHLMRALESAANIVADRIGATIRDGNGRGLPWGVVADNMKPKIDAMTKGSEQQIKWYRVQQNLVVINRAWRVPTNHPKESYTPDEAQEIFDATGPFMRELAPLV